jgi:hypothetical protein
VPNNTLLTDQHIVNEALMILENDLTFTKQVDRQLDSEFKNAKRGATISVRKAPKYVLRDGQTAVIQATTQTQVPFTLSHQFGVDVEFYSSDLALSISDFGRDILAPQISVIANGIDWAGMQCALQVANAVGTPATTPGTGMTAQQTLGLYLQAGALLDKNATASARRSSTRTRRPSWWRICPAYFRTPLRSPSSTRPAPWVSPQARSSRWIRTQM